MDLEQSAFEALRFASAQSLGEMRLGLRSTGTFTKLHKKKCWQEFMRNRPRTKCRRRYGEAAM